MTRPRSKTLTIVATLAGLCFAGLLFFLARTILSLPKIRDLELPAEPPPRAREEPEVVPKKLGEEFLERARRNRYVPETDEPKRPTVDVSWETALWKSENFQEFVNMAAPTAEEGDVAAQFAVSQAYNYCGSRNLAKDATPLATARCGDLLRAHPKKEELSKLSMQWLEKAVAGNYPRALATIATIDLTRTGGTRAERKLRLAAAKARLIDAANANDPWITYVAARSVQLLHSSNKRAETAAWVWRYAACEQGMPCDEDAPWLLEACRRSDDCQEGETGRQYIRRKSLDLASLQARARQLAETLREGQLDEAAFDATVTGLPEPRVRVENRAKVIGVGPPK